MFFVLFFFSNILFENTHQERTQAFVSCFSAISLIMTKRGIHRLDLWVFEWAEVSDFHQLLGGWLGSALPE